MNATSRELAYALQNHPNSKALLTGAPGRALIVASQPETTEALKASLLDVFDPSKLSIETVLAQEFVKSAVETQQPFEAAIFLNVFSDLGFIEERQKMADIVSALLRMLRVGGIVVIRENLEKHTARMIAELTKFFDLFATSDPSQQQQTLGFHFYGMAQLQDSIYARSNFLDVYWIMSKITEERKCNDDGDCSKLATFREFLDRTQYTEDNVQSYEWIFGDNFISPGGIDENRRVLRYLRSLRHGQKMLDIGVGIGGGARQAAREFGFHVLGCDLSSNMIQHAFERNHRDKDHRVEFQIADAMVFRYEPNSFDIVFSRDCIQHIIDTQRLFENIFTWLKPGGQVLLTMYGRGHGTLSPVFNEYVRKRQYMLRTMEEFRELARKNGFANIYTENMTPRFREILVEERDRAVRNRKEFIEKFGESLYENLIGGWEDKLQFIDDDNHNWLLLRAEKPAHIMAQITEAGA